MLDVYKEIIAKGRRELKRHLKREKLTHREAILAKCYDCMGDYRDGKSDCEITDCSLHPFMPYKGIKYQG